jgi:capsular exopolysaccharide synthesis family protein
MSTYTVKRSLISHLDPFCPASNNYRTLQNMIEHSPSGQKCQVILVSSAEPLEGKTTTATNLSIAYAHANRKVLLIDGNAYRPSLHHVFSTSNEIGLCNIQSDSLSLEEAVKDVGIRNLSVLTSGLLLSSSYTPLDADLTAALLQRARELYDIVIIDSPALLALTDTSILAVNSDGVLLVVHSVISRRDQTLQAKKLLDQLHVPIVGCVLNGTKAPSKPSYYHYSASRHS